MVAITLGQIGVHGAGPVVSASGHEHGHIGGHGLHVGRTGDHVAVMGRIVVVNIDNAQLAEFCRFVGIQIMNVQSVPPVHLVAKNLVAGFRIEVETMGLW